MRAPGIMEAPGNMEDTIPAVVQEGQNGSQCEQDNPCEVFHIRHDRGVQNDD